MDQLKKLFGGRMSRTTFFCYHFALSILLAFVMHFYPYALQDKMIMLLFSLIMWPLIGLSLAVWVKRFHDINKSGYWAVLSMIPMQMLSYLFFYCSLRAVVKKINMVILRFICISRVLR